ncbi:MAG: hypothetical protein KC619_18660 [Myxococcales bacterium]|nr:hypothetical protein [Myxococcales bacterium]
MSVWIRNGGWASLGVALAMVGCATSGEPEPGAVALLMVGDALDSMAETPSADAMHQRSIGALARRCDPEPAVTRATLCEREVAAIELAWEDCLIAAGPEAPAELEGATSSGTVASWVELDDPDACGGAVRHARFVVDGSLPTGAVSHLEGVVTSTLGEQAAGIVISASRSVAFDDTRRFEATLDGELTRSEGGLSGELAFAHVSPRGARNGALTLSGIVRTPECRWPVAGTVRRVDREGVEHELAFGPDCGAATRDGEPVDLSAMSRFGRRGSRP